MAGTDTLTASLASAFAELALGNVVREYPNKPDHTLAGPADLRSPRELHPAFYGSFDWHSCVHMHWLLVRLRRLHPDLPQRHAIAAVLERHLTPENVAAECAYLARPQSRTFSRTYGWAWLLALAREMADAGSDDADAARWSRHLAPLAQAMVERYLAYLPLQRYPLRSGLHPNSAFGLLFALEYARAAAEPGLEALCLSTARRWFEADRGAPLAWEPSGADFLSPVLVEAALMHRVLPTAAYSSWLAAFLPELASGRSAPLFVPAEVADRSDPFLVHLDGLNLSRAWCLRDIAGALPAADPRIAPLRESATAHIAAGMSGLASGDYLGEHWLATFAVLALTA